MVVSKKLSYHHNLQQKILMALLSIHKYTFAFLYALPDTKNPHIFVTVLVNIYKITV